MTKASDFDVLLQKSPPEQLLKPRWGAVTALSPLRVKLDGDDVQLPLTPASLVTGLSVGDRVWTILSGRQLVILGVWGGVPFPPAPDLTPYALIANLPVPEKVTRVARSTNLDTGLDVWTTIPWQTEVFDDAGAWTSGAPTRITTPAGFSRVKLTLYTAWTSSTTQPGRFSLIAKNGNVSVASNRREMFESAEQITTGWIPTVAGDYYHAAANSHGSGADLLGVGPWGGPTWMEAVFRQ